MKQHLSFVEWLEGSFNDRHYRASKDRPSTRDHTILSPLHIYFDKDRFINGLPSELFIEGRHSNR